MNRNVIIGLSVFALAAIVFLVVPASRRAARAPNPQPGANWKLVVNLPPTNAQAHSPQTNTPTKTNSLF